MKPPEVEIRPAAPEDVPDVVHSYAWLFAPPGRGPPNWNEQRAAESLGRLISSPDSSVFVASSEGLMVGLEIVYLDIESVRFGRRAWIEDLAVHPDFRSRGIGKLLLEEAKRWGRAHGATHLELETGEGRIDAQRFYEREHPVSRSKCYRWEL
ncbi:MAG: GNAT family N-acetyltransferase [Thermoplasmata archaeon]